jgi:hypothetical protein
VIAAGVAAAALSLAGTSGAARRDPRVRAHGARAHAAAAKDSFSGHITAARGALAHDGGAAAVVLATPQSTGQRVRSLGLTVRGASCGHRPRCLTLAGTLRGTISMLAPANPDLGRILALHASGTLRPLGTVRISGTVHGTGFIARGSRCG